MVHVFLIVALAVILGGWVLSLLLRRFSSKLGTELALAAGLVGRIAVIVVMAYSAVRAFTDGGGLVALAILFALIGLGAVVTSAINAAALWMVFTGRVRE